MYREFLINKYYIHITKQPVLETQFIYLLNIGTYFILLKGTHFVVLNLGTHFIFLLNIETYFINVLNIGTHFYIY